MFISLICEILAHDGSMVLLDMVCHGSHQYTPVMLAYIPYMDPMGIVKCQPRILLNHGLLIRGVTPPIVISFDT